MQKLTFTAKYQGKRCSFVISPVPGGNSTWHLYIDKYYKGQFGLRGDRWVFLPQNEDAFTKEQIVILEGQLNKHWDQHHGFSSSDL